MLFANSTSMLHHPPVIDTTSKSADMSEGLSDPFVSTPADAVLSSDPPVSSAQLDPHTPTSTETIGSSAAPATPSLPTSKVFSYPKSSDVIYTSRGNFQNTSVELTYLPTVSSTETAMLSTPAPVHPSMSGGSVAAVAIGCLIAGAAVTVLALLLFYRRQRPVRPHSDTGESLRSKSTFGSDELTIPGTKSEGVVAQSEDTAIAGELSKIREDIKGHVRSYCHLGVVSTSDISCPKLMALATATGLKTSMLAEMLSNQSTRRDTLQLFIAWAILSRCEGSRCPTFLPKDIAPLALLVADIPEKTLDQLALYSQWKSLTGALLRQHPGHVQDLTFSDVNGELDNVLAPFVQGSLDGGHRRRNLDMIMRQAAKFAVLLFCQQACFRFDFRTSSDGVVIFPALMQVTTSHDPPRILWEKETRALTETEALELKR
ncbi:hypothetical protein BDV95DRAFT_602981 [Massariosphaeria phaeospora]|uniref:Uncharacterized protein n=1 Tax=Massariosphaeria phaeospora TaxID=100035 RepID=A0A7C8MKE3_9PLEO|nr:hypothetical protein BDV95DRAFT_602981 [Massariosphaeria phaeospora]